MDRGLAPRHALAEVAGVLRVPAPVPAVALLLLRELLAPAAGELLVRSARITGRNQSPARLPPDVPRPYGGSPALRSRAADPCPATAVGTAPHKDGSTMNGPAPGWLPDPDARHEYRYWDGSGWTDDVADGGVASTDPVSGGVPAPPPPSSGVEPGGEPGTEPTTQIDPTEEFPVSPVPPARPYPGAGAAGVGPDSGQYAQYPAPTRPGKRPSTALIAGLVVLAIALVGGGIWLLVRDDGDESADDASEVSDESGDDTGETSGDDTASDDTTGDDTAGDDTPGDESGSSLPEDLDLGNENAIVDAIASALEDVAGGEITHDQAVCVSEGFIDEFGLFEIASGTNPFSAEAQAQMTEIFERCDVDPEALSGPFGG